VRAPWELQFDPVELLERLATLTPRPRIHLLLYHGVLAPRAAWRALVVRFVGTGTPGPIEADDDVEEDPAEADCCHGSNYLWAELMRRSLGLDVLACPRCGGRLTLIALIDEPAVVRRVLQHLGLPTEVPEARPARAPPLLDGAPRIDATDEFYVDDPA
jgi:CTP:molybdopterin cytidylyltransferase MocA